MLRTSREPPHSLTARPQRTVVLLRRVNIVLLGASLADAICAPLATAFRVHRVPALQVSPAFATALLVAPLLIQAAVTLTRLLPGGRRAAIALPITHEDGRFLAVILACLALIGFRGGLAAIAYPAARVAFGGYAPAFCSVAFVVAWALGLRRSNDDD